MNPLSPAQPESPWPHRLAVAMLCVTFPLIWVGGLVTTYDAGMAVDDWPSTWGYNLFLYPWKTWVFGPFNIFIEHGHRLLGALAGMLSILFVLAVYRGDSRRWMRLLAWLALALVIVQGLLGGARVLLDERALAMIHGCVGPAFFAFCVGLAVLTSRLWRDPPAVETRVKDDSLGRLTIATSALVYLQLVIGAQLRHVPAAADPNHFRLAVFFHLLVAAAVAGYVAAVTWTVLSRHRGQAALRRPALALGLLTILQLALGAAAWVVKYAWPTWISGFHWTSGYTIQANSMSQALTVTAHVATGSLILVISVLLSMRTFLILRPRPQLHPPGKMIARLVV